MKTNTLYPAMLLPFLLCASFLIATCGTVASAQTRYRGEGSQVEAMGTIMSAYMAAALTLEKCQSYPALKSEAIKAMQEYLRRNQQVYMDVMRKMPQLAYNNGGQKEVLALKAELEQLGNELERQIPKAVQEKTVLTEKQAREFLDRVNSGLCDLIVNYNNEVTRILNP